jgi:hypothetical protein
MLDMNAAFECELLFPCISKEPETVSVSVQDSSTATVMISSSTPPASRLCQVTRLEEMPPDLEA